MKVDIEMGNLSDTIAEVIEQNIQKTVDDIIATKVQEFIDQNYKSAIEEIANRKMTDYIEDYIKTATITVGGGWDAKNNPVETYTVEEYIKKQIGEIMSNKSFTIKKKNAYGDYRNEKTSFEDFIKTTFNVDEVVEGQLSTFMRSTKENIKNQIKEMFDTTTKNMLSETVFNMLVSTDTYSKINNGIKMLGGGT